MRFDSRTPAAAAARRPIRGDRRKTWLGGLFVAFVAAVALGALYRGALSGPVHTSHATRTDNDLATGSIVFVPIFGDRCRNALIDNATWRIRDNGIVDCRAALAQNADARRLNWSTPRIGVILDGFKRR